MEQGGSNQGTLKEEEPTEFPRVLDVCFERKKNQDGFEILRTWASRNWSCHFLKWEGLRKCKCRLHLWAIQWGGQVDSWSQGSKWGWTEGAQRLSPGASQQKRWEEEYLAKSTEKEQLTWPKEAQESMEAACGRRRASELKAAHGVPETAMDAVLRQWGGGGYKRRNDANPVTPNTLYIFEFVFGQSWVTICK